MGFRTRDRPSDTCISPGLKPGQIGAIDVMPASIAPAMASHGVPPDAEYLLDSHT